MQAFNLLRIGPRGISNPEQLHRVSALPMPLQTGAGVGRFRLEHELRQLIRRHHALLQPKRHKRLGGHAQRAHHAQKRRGTAEAPPLKRSSIDHTRQRKGAAITPDPLDLEHLINSETHLPAQRPHAAREHVAKPRQPRQTSRHGSAVGKQGIQHRSHTAARSNPDRLLRGLPLQTLEMGLKIESPVVSHSGAGCGAPATYTERPGAGPVLNQSRQLRWSRGDQTGSPRISRLRIEENGTV